ncbi:hypothetical protein [Maricaulis sp.]|uniref:hypothetical protein n=1 Tax=Maricaulis sp. TaxID=1486257 RepID=UPI00263572A7|nr:hypothetical protein [Maricaulis sp.]
MSPTYSMDGFELSQRDGIIEIRTWGDRPAGELDQTTRLFDTLAAPPPGAIPVTGVLYDARESFYDLSEVAMQQRVRTVARQLGPFRVACIIRPDQEALFQQFRKAHAGHGHAASAFASVEDGRDWLRSGAAVVQALP